MFLSNQHKILERYFASARRLPKSRTPKDSKGSKGPRTPPHHSTSHCVPGSGHQVPSKTSPKHLQVLPRADRRGQGLQRTPKAPKDRGPLHTTAQAIAYRDPGTRYPQKQAHTTCKCFHVSTAEAKDFKRLQRLQRTADPSTPQHEPPRTGISNVISNRSLHSSCSVRNRSITKSAESMHFEREAFIVNSRICPLKRSSPCTLYT